MIRFRFQDLKIWQLAIQIADELFTIADALEQKRSYFDLQNSFVVQACLCQTT
jgi:hypothetical protein